MDASQELYIQKHMYRHLQITSEVGGGQAVTTSLC